MRLRSPSYRQLEALVALLETGSVTRAAERMHISQPAISRLIASLEADVGYPMFRRAGGRMMAERGLGVPYTTIPRWVIHYVPEFEKRWKR